MLGLKLVHVSIRGPRNATPDTTLVMHYRHTYLITSSSPLTIALVSGMHSRCNFFLVSIEITKLRFISIIQWWLYHSAEIQTHNNRADSKQMLKFILYSTHWGRDKMATISRTTFSNAFSWMKMYDFRLQFHCNLFSKVQLTTYQATSHYLKQWCFDHRRIYAALGLNELTLTLTNVKFYLDESIVAFVVMWKHHDVNTITDNVFQRQFIPP